MKIVIKSSVIFFFLLLNNCKYFSHIIISVDERKLIEGEWVSVQDSAYSLNISASQIIEYYNQEQQDIFKYEILNYSCDTAYMKSGVEKVSFFKKYKENDSYIFCYEILGLTKEYLSLQYTVNAKRILFRREPVK